MKPVDQTTWGDDGNCWAACLASLLECSIEEIPDFSPAACRKRGSGAVPWWAFCDGWLRNEHNLALLMILGPNEQSLVMRSAHHIVSGMGPRGIPHSVIALDGDIVHDPHPEGGGLTQVGNYAFLLGRWR